MAFRTRYAIPVLLAVVVSTANWARPQEEYRDFDWPKFHAQDLREWARKSGLSTAILKRLLRAAGLAEDADYYHIGKVDALSLKKRGQVLLSVYGLGTAAALTVFAIDTRTPYYRKVWEAGGAPGRDFYASILGPARAFVSPQGNILVKLPDWNREGLMSKENSDLIVVEYKWTGKTYRLDSEKRFHRYKWAGNDWEVLGK